MVRPGVICQLLLLPLAACTLPGSVALDPALERVAYHTPGGEASPAREVGYVTADGSRLGYLEYRAREPRGALVYLHGIESHAGWFAAAADALCAAGFDVYCLDRRGSGINRENRGFISGHVDRYEILLEDIETVVQDLRSRYARLYMIGLSWGGKLALAYSLTHPGELDGLVLITPGLVARVRPGLLDLAGILLCAGPFPTAQFETPIEPEMFTETPEVLEKLRRDPLRLRYASARFFYQSLRLDGLVDDLIGQNRCPIELFLAGKDQIIDNEAVLELLRRGAGGPLKEVLYEDQTHSIQFDATDRLVRDMVAWIENVCPGAFEKPSEQE
ncbi:MAG: alpha/beta fold hydrolase [Planctomycetota bacterium]